MVQNLFWLKFHTIPFAVVPRNPYVSYYILQMFQRITFVTNSGECNLSCLMCREFGERKVSLQDPQMPFDWIEKSVQSLVGKGLQEIIPSTMGEPLLYSQFDSLISLLQQNDLKLNLTTNGTFPRGGVDVWLPKLMPILSDIKFSIQALTSEVNERIMRGIDAGRQRRNILSFLQARNEGIWKPTITLQVTVQRKNLGELTPLVLWAIENGIDRVKVNRVRVHRPRLMQELHVSDEEWNQVVADLKHLQATQNRIDGTPIQLVCQGLGGKGQGKCPFLGKVIWVAQDGEIRFCPHPLYRNGAFPFLGNVLSVTLEECWNSETYKSFLGNYEESNFCQNCSFRLNLEL